MKDNSIKIQPTSLELVKSFRLAVKSVAMEAKFLSTATGYSLKSSTLFVKDIVKNNWTQFYAVKDNQVVGWCDVIPSSKEMFAHVGTLGIGVIKEFRGKGIGKRLMQVALNDAKQKGVEKVELEVFASNQVAKNFYKKVGFEVEGVKKKSKKYQGEYEDVIIMGLWLGR